MPQPDRTDQSWAWLILLLGISALVMTVWFVLYPVAALLCTLSGIFICLVAIVLSEAQAGMSDYQARKREI